MLWYKGWIETRMRVWIALGWTLVLLVSVSLRPVAPSPAPVLGLALMIGSQVTVMCVWFAGAGIASQSSVQFLKGLHGSTQYTLSLPASRLRLLAVRAALGWIQMAGVIAILCTGVWLTAPALTAHASAVRDVLEYAITVIVCGSAIYFLSVLLATFLDDQWRSWATMLIALAVAAVPSLTAAPSYTDLYRAIGENSPLVARHPTLARDGVCRRDRDVRIPGRAQNRHREGIPTDMPRSPDMLWYKGWRETRVQIGADAVHHDRLHHLVSRSRGQSLAGRNQRGVRISTPTISRASSSSPAPGWRGAGIATQPPFQAVKGLHGSTLFSPFRCRWSRFHLLAVRAGIGWLEMIGVIGLQCCGMWFALPFLKGTATSREMFEYAGTLAACASVVYFLSVFLGTFPDDQWRMWGTMLGAAALWWMPRHTSLPAAADIFRGVGEASPLWAHSVPWTTMGVSLGLSAFLLLAALKIVKAREY